MRTRQYREYGTWEDRKKWFDEVKAPLLAERGGKCERCGSTEKVVVHHVLPWGRFKEFERDKRNLMLVCADCHREIHQNPFLESSMIRKKAKELKVDWKVMYGNPPIKE